MSEKYQGLLCRTGPVEYFYITRCRFATSAETAAATAATAATAAATATGAVTDRLVANDTVRKATRCQH